MRKVPRKLAAIVMLITMVISTFIAIVVGLPMVNIMYINYGIILGSFGSLLMDYGWNKEDK